jgi:hypothetical protein
MHTKEHKLNSRTSLLLWLTSETVDGGDVIIARRRSALCGLRWRHSWRRREVVSQGCFGCNDVGNKGLNPFPMFLKPFSLLLWNFFSFFTLKKLLLLLFFITFFIFYMIWLKYPHPCQIFKKSHHSFSLSLPPSHRQVLDNFFWRLGIWSKD